MITNSIRLNILVEGHVQGIGFRYFVMEKAAALGLTGWVKNLDNGCVEIEAQGPKDNIDNLVEALKNGHPFATISAVNVSVMATIKEESDFLIHP